MLLEIWWLKSFCGSLFRLYISQAQDLDICFWSLEMIKDGHLVEPPMLLSYILHNCLFKLLVE